MPLPKQSATFNFAQGLDTFQDPNQLPIGKFLSLQNSVFIGATEDYGRLSKRNGYGLLTTLGSSSKYITTFRDSLVGISDSDIKVYSSASGITRSVGYIKNIQLQTLPILRSANAQTAYDSSLSINGSLICTAYTEVNAVSSGASFPSQKVLVSDVTTGVPVFGPTALNNIIGSTSATPCPQVYTLGSNFAIVYHNLAAGSATLFLTTVSQTNPAALSAPIQVSNLYAMQTTGSATGIRSFDGIVASNTLFLAIGQAVGTTTGQLLLTSFSSSLNPGATNVIGSSSGQVNHVTLAISSASIGSGTLFVAYTSANVLGYGNQILYSMFSDYSGHVNASAAVVQNGGYTQNLSSYLGDNAIIYTEQSTRVSTLGSALTTHCVTNFNVSLANVWDTRNVTLQINAGLGSKPFIVNREPYFLTNYYSAYQSSYFISNSAGGTLGKFAYGGGPGYVTNGLPKISTLGSVAFSGYLDQFISTPANKNTNVSSTTQTAGTFTQLGINLAEMDFSGQMISAIETAGNLHINGSQIWNLDGASVAEHNFHLYPEILQISETGGGTLAGTQNFFYTSCYKYIDNAGNVFRSAPSIPLSVSVIGTNSSVRMVLNNIGQTLKSGQIFIEVYRWSQSQQTYYLTAILNNNTNHLVQYVTGNASNNTSFQYLDNNTDATIIGNQVLYTTGGVVEDTAPPACNAFVIFDSRFWLVDAEDTNLLWYSKALIEAAPVESSDLFTYFVPETVSGQNVSGAIRALGAMDDKLILFKKNAILYINGTGPDDTGANSQYSPPIIVASSIGCANQNSIVLMPNGLMFQSDKGIWLLKHDMSVEYIGKDVDLYNNRTVLSAQAIPGTNQIRFILSGNTVLCYDYFVNQWATFTNVNGVSATIVNGLHTVLDPSGNVLQETPGQYSDNGTPVVMQFQTGFVNVTNLQGYQRAYRAYLLGQYQSGHTYSLGIAYDYNASIVQSPTITPTNTSGSGSQVEQWQVNFQRQQCQSFQLTFQETASGTAGAGLSLSGLNLVYGSKKSYPRNIGPRNRIG